MIGCVPKERSSEILILTMAEITRTTETGLALPNGDRCALFRSQRAQSRATSSNLQGEKKLTNVDVRNMSQKQGRLDCIPGILGLIMKFRERHAHLKKQSK